MVIKQPADVFLSIYIILTSAVFLTTCCAAVPCCAREGNFDSHFYLDGGPLVSPGSSREPINTAAVKPGIYRGFLIWRQRYAHLALCNMMMCHGSCLAYGDGCVVCAQDPVLPLLLGESGSGCAGMPVGR
jgi:hypothetical protein